MGGSDDATTMHGATAGLPPLDERSVAVVVSHPDGVEVLVLQPGRPVTIGRSDPSDARYRCARLSRAHLRLERRGEAVWATDLDSTNGTFLNGRRLDGAVRLHADDELALGSVRARLHVLTAWEAKLQGIATHERFERELEEEVLRARTFRRPVGLLLARRAGCHVGGWAAEIHALLRPVDRVGLYASDTLEILLPEADGDVAGELAQRLLRAVDGLRIGLATWPGRADGHALFEGARRALARADAKRPVVDDVVGAVAPTAAAGPLVIDPAMRELYGVVARLAPARIPVLVVGETGTGKELVARALHERGPRSGGPLRALNCGAIPASLVESVLFGHERGAFTGADARRAGLFEEADGGTVFLDEVGELAPAAQVALLRVLETKRLTRVGGHEEIEVDVRVVAATHRDLRAMCEDGSFRLDLYYRLETMTLRVPPLRERRAEIAPLAERFLAEAVAANGLPPRDLSPVAVAALEAYDWPGNVRELRNVIERAALVADGRSIRAEHLPERVERARRAPVAGAPAREAVASAVDLPTDLKGVVRACEAALIRQALREAGGNRSEAARALGMPRRTLMYKLQTGELDASPAEEAHDLAVLARHTGPGDEGRELRARMERIERRVLEAAVAAHGSVEAVAAALELHPRTVASKLARYADP